MPLDHRGDLFRGAHHIVQIAAQNADADGRVHARGQHVDAVLDRHRPDVGPARHLHGAIELAAEARQLVAIGLPEQEPPAERIGKSLLQARRARAGLENELRLARLAAMVMVSGAAGGLRARRQRQRLRSQPS